MAYCLPSRDYKLFRMYKIYDDPQRMFTEVLYWKEEFKILSYEFKIYTALLANQMAERSKSQYVNFDQLFERLEDLMKTNENLSSLVTISDNKWEGIRECDDLQCEAHFLEEYIELKQKMESYLADVQSLKKIMIGELCPKG